MIGVRVWIYVEKANISKYMREKRQGKDAKDKEKA